MIQQRTLPGRKDGPSSGSLALIISLLSSRPMQRPGTGPRKFRLRAGRELVKSARE